MARAKKSLHDLNVSTCSTCLAWHSIKVGADEKARGYCRLNPPEMFEDYLEASPTSWRSGFAVLTFKDGKLLWPEVVHKFDEDHVEFRGDLIKV